MKTQILVLVFLVAIVSSAPFSEGAKGPALAMLVETEPLGSGTVGTVMGVVVQIAPEDVPRAGERLRVVTALKDGDTVVDRQSVVVEVEADGSAMMFRDWPVGDFSLEVGIATVDGSTGGLWIGEVTVPEQSESFEAPEDAPVEAVALAVSAPLEGAVRFLPPPDRGGIGALQLEVEAPEGVSSVEFFKDGESLSRRNRPPWTVSISLGNIVKRTQIRAVARDKQGRYVGEDALVLNNPTGSIGVEILLGPDEAVVNGNRPVTVSVMAGTSSIHQVTLSLDDRVVARWASCPCVTSIPQADLDQAVIIAAETIDSKGLRGDAVIGLAGGGSFTGSVRVELVELPITVLDQADNPVLGLAPEEFAILEDDHQVTVEGFGTTEDLPLSLALAVDTSGSMIDNYHSVLQAARVFANDLMKEGDEVVVLTFAWEAKVRLPWTEYSEAIAPKLDRIVPEGGTSLHDAVVRSLEQFRGRRGRQALVLLTDGEDTTSRTGWELAERFAHTMRIPIYPIGLGLGRMAFGGRKTLKKLAEETGGEAFFPKTTEELPAVYARIGDLLRSQYLVWYSSGSLKPEEEFRAITVTVPNRPEATIRTIRGYYPGK